MEKIVQKKKMRAVCNMYLHKKKGQEKVNKNINEVFNVRYHVFLCILIPSKHLLYIFLDIHYIKCAPLL